MTKFLDEEEKVLIILMLGLLIRIATSGVQKDWCGHFLDVKRSFLDKILVSCNVNISIFLYFFKRLAVFANLEGVARPFTFKVLISMFINISSEPFSGLS